MENKLTYLGTDSMTQASVGHDLVQQASGCKARRGKLFMIEKLMLEGATIYMAEQYDDSSDALKKQHVVPNLMIGEQINVPGDRFHDAGISGTCTEY